MAVTMTRERAMEVAREFRQGIETIYGPRLKGVYLYGSCARDKADDDSVIDVAVVLTGPVNHEAQRREVSQVRADLSLRENCVLMPFFLSEREFETTPYAIHRCVVTEGVPV